MKAKEESEKNGLKLNIQKNEDNGIWSHQFIANTWGKMKTVLDFIVLGSKISADGDCSHEVKRHLLLERKAMTNLDSIIKCRYITLTIKSDITLPIVKAMVFPVVLNGSVSQTIKKTEYGRIDAFKLWCWRRLWRVLWTARRYN